MNKTEEVAAEGVEAKVSATIDVKALITRIRVNQAKILNSFLPVSPIF